MLLQVRVSFDPSRKSADRHQKERIQEVSGRARSHHVHDQEDDLLLLLSGLCCSPAARLFSAFSYGSSLFADWLHPSTKEFVGHEYSVSLYNHTPSAKRSMALYNVAATHHLVMLGFKYAFGWFAM